MKIPATSGGRVRTEPLRRLRVAADKKLWDNDRYQGEVVGQRHLCRFAKTGRWGENRAYLRWPGLSGFVRSDSRRH